tara:strand:+ start:482 stop:799 length:318 start_codon:yes stop_codon:yes gene_type:complete
MITQKPNLFDVIHSLVGGSISGGLTNDGYEYHDGQIPPTEKEIETEFVRLEKEYSDNEFARKRASAFPSIHDVTVALAEKAEGNSQMWDTITAQRLEVKSRFPKP